MAKYNLAWHLRMCHNVTMEFGKLGRPSIQEEGPKHENHATTNVQILSNPLTPFYHNEQKVIAKARKHVNLEWDRLHIVL